MKKSIISLVIIVLLLVGSSLIFTYPHTKPISSSIQSVQYQLKEDAVTPLTININGRLHYSLLGTKRFQGTISIEGESFSDPNQDRPLNMRFYESGKGLMSFVLDYEDLSDGQFWNDRYGSVFVSTDFSKATIEVKDPDARVLISGPATDRTEALEIAKELMKDYIKEYNQKGYFEDMR